VMTMAFLRSFRLLRKALVCKLLIFGDPLYLVAIRIASTRACNARNMNRESLWLLLAYCSLCSKNFNFPQFECFNSNASIRNPQEVKETNIDMVFCHEHSATLIQGLKDNQVNWVSQASNNSTDSAIPSRIEF